MDHMKMIAKLVIENRKISLMWTDLILKYPEDLLIGMSTELVGKMDEILAEAGRLSDRFTELSYGFLYDAEIEEQNKLRVLPIKVLYSCFSKLK